MISQLIENGRSFLILQGSLSLVIILIAPTIYTWLNLDYLQLSIFRVGTIGAFFSAMNFFLVVLFSYYDSKENMLRLTMFMFLTNAIFSLITLELGFPFYGYGFTLSMILTFTVGSIIFIRFLTNLHYHIFISNIVKQVKYRGRGAEVALEERGKK